MFPLEADQAFLISLVNIQVRLIQMKLSPVPDAESRFVMANYISAISSQSVLVQPVSPIIISSLYRCKLISFPFMMKVIEVASTLLRL